MSTAPASSEWLFDLSLVASIRVLAKDEGEARARLNTLLDCLSVQPHPNGPDLDPTPDGRFEVSIGDDEPPRLWAAASGHPGSRECIAIGEQFAASEDRHGYIVTRRSDGQQWCWGGDDCSEKFRDLFESYGGDPSPVGPDQSGQDEAIDAMGDALASGEITP